MWRTLDGQNSSSIKKRIRFRSAKQTLLGWMFSTRTKLLGRLLPDCFRDLVRWVHVSRAVLQLLLSRIWQCIWIRGLLIRICGRSYFRRNLFLKYLTYFYFWISHVRNYAFFFDTTLTLLGNLTYVFHKALEKIANWNWPESPRIMSKILNLNSKWKSNKEKSDKL